MSYVIARPWGGHCGIGHQFHNRLVSQLLAKRYNLTFVHAPFCGDVLEPQIDVPVRIWEDFLGFGHGHITESQLPTKIKRVQLPFIDMKWDGSSYDGVHCDNEVWRTIIEENRLYNVLFECAKDQFTGIDWAMFDFNELQNQYSLARIKNPIACNFDTNKTNIVLHIRRGDVTKNGKYSIRWVETTVYQNVIEQIRRQISNAVFHIYTEGNVDSLLNLSGNDVILHGRVNVFETFHHMTRADILMPGNSSFSLLASYLCEGIILCREWPPLWVNFPNDPRFVIVNQWGNIANDLVRN